MLDSAGFLTEHMVVHILAMNVAAPLAIFGWRQLAGRAPGAIANARWIGPASALQILLLWGWHLPAPMAFAYAVPAGEALMHGTLFAAALWFWNTIINDAEASRWRSLGALLITGKLFCLLGVLLTFAPRALYLRAAELCLGGPVAAEALVPDQQLAGLIMLVACPLVYVLGGVIIAARWLNEIDKRPASHIAESMG